MAIRPDDSRKSGIGHGVILAAAVVALAVLLVLYRGHMRTPTPWLVVLIVAVIALRVGLRASQRKLREQRTERLAKLRSEPVLHLDDPESPDHV